MKWITPLYMYKSVSKKPFISKWVGPFQGTGEVATQNTFFSYKNYVLSLHHRTYKAPAGSPHKGPLIRSFDVFVNAILKKTVEQRVDLPVIYDVIPFMCRYFNVNWKICSYL